MKRTQFWNEDQWRKESRQFWIKYFLRGVVVTLLFFALLIGIGYLAAHGAQIDHVFRR